jgi:hypothetical protein
MQWMSREEGRPVPMSGFEHGQSMWDFRWTEWHWDKFFPEFFGFPLSVPFHRRSAYSCTIWETNDTPADGRSSETVSSHRHGQAATHSNLVVDRTYLLQSQTNGAEIRFYFKVQKSHGAATRQTTPGCDWGHKTRERVVLTPSVLRHNRARQKTSHR